MPGNVTLCSGKYYSNCTEKAAFNQFQAVYSIAECKSEQKKMCKKEKRINNLVLDAYQKVYLAVFMLKKNKSVIGLGLLSLRKEP